MSSPLHRDAEHESGFRHASGRARYVDDLPTPPGTLVAQIHPSPIPRGRITRLSADAARRTPGVAAVLLAGDIPGVNDISPQSHDEPLLADGEVFTVGQAVALVVAESYEACRAGAAAIEAEYEALPAILDLEQALAAESFLTAPHRIERGDVAAALASSALVLEGELRTGGQDHFYLETQVALATPDEDSLAIFSSTQHPSEVQAKVAEVLGLQRHRVVVTAPRMGGGFGGKETQAAHVAALAALAAHRLGRPVKLWLNRDQDMAQTGKRHPFRSRYTAGFDSQGKLQALAVDVWSDGGWSADLSQAILDRCLFHLDNAYFVPALRFVGRVCKTNLPSNTAFRGFGGPQGVAVIEAIMDRAAARLAIDPAELRRRNYYADGEPTPYGQPVPAPRLARIHAELIESADYAARSAEIEAFNLRSRHAKRGLALGPVKFGISFTYSVLNQAGALVVLYADGTCQLNHGGTEMGQGLHTKMLAVAADALGLPIDRVRVMSTATDKVPNTSATAASSGADLNGQAVKAACDTLIARLRPVAAELLQGAAAEVRFAGGAASIGARAVPFAAVTQRAWERQISLSATGFYATPNIHYDRVAGRGKPFHYFAYGAAISEVEVDGFTGEHHVRRVDILHDVGDSLVPSIDRGQIEGAYIQGLGWLTREELITGPDGVLRTHSPDTYKIPAIGDAPLDFRVKLLERAAEPGVIHGSKAVGEPPFMLALSVTGALRRAIAAFASDGREVELSIPSTPEAVLRAVESIRAPRERREGAEDGENGHGGLRGVREDQRQQAGDPGEAERRVADDELR